MAEVGAPPGTTVYTHLGMSIALGALAEQAGAIPGLQIAWSPYTNAWYASIPHCQITDGTSLTTASSAHSQEPADALAALWKTLTTLGPGQAIVVDRLGSEANRRTVRWNGYMWMDVLDPANDDGGS